MDSSSTYLFKGMGEGQMKKILAAGREIAMKKGQQIVKVKCIFAGVTDSDLMRRSMGGSIF